MAIDLLQFIKNVEASSLQSMLKKYSSTKFLEVAKLLEWVFEYLYIKRKAIAS